MERNATLLANLLFYKCLFLGQSGIYKKHQPQMEKASSFVFFLFFCSFGQPSLKPCAGALWRGRGKVGAQDAGFCGRGVGGQGLCKSSPVVGWRGRWGVLPRPAV